MPGPLPSTGQPGHGIQLLPDHWLKLLLLLGHQEQGGPVKQGQKEGQPVNPEEKQEAQRGVLEEEIHAL